MSTAAESSPEEAPATPPSKPPFYRRPLALIIAGALVLVLIAGVIVTAVLLHGSVTTAHLADAGAGHPAAPAPSLATGAKASATATPTPTPTPTPIAAQPQVGAAVSPPAASAPIAPAPPAAPAPAPPVTTGPGRSSGPTITSFVVAPQICPNGPDLGPVPVKISWSYSNGNEMYLKDQYGELVGAGPNGWTESNNPGSVTFMIPCNAHDDPITIKVLKTTYPPSSTTKTGDIMPVYTHS